MDYTSLPTSLTVGGRNYAIRYDYRVVIDIINVLNNPEYQETEKYYSVLKVFYVDYQQMPIKHFQEAMQRCFEFISYGNDEGNGLSLMSWMQDIKYIIPPVSRIIGQDVRSIGYDAATNTGGLHWWTFLSAYMEIGECLFANILKIREKLASGKKLDASEQEWYRRNKAMIDLRSDSTAAEDALVAEWT